MDERTFCGIGKRKEGAGLERKKNQCCALNESPQGRWQACVMGKAGLCYKGNIFVFLLHRKYLLTLSPGQLNILKDYSNF